MFPKVSVCLSEESGHERWSPPPMAHNPSNSVQPWVVPPQNTNWSDDHWPEDQQFGNEPTFGSEENRQRFQNSQRSRINPWAQNRDVYQNNQRYQNDQRFGERYPNEQRYSNEYSRDSMFVENLRQVNNTMMEVVRRRQLLSNSMNSSRYMPY